MSKYTTEVRFICETNSGLSESVGYNDVEQVIAGARGKIFDFDYPIFDSEYKSVIETKILKHFYTREIGAETVGLWKLWLNTRMNEIMPYYNQLYKSTLLEYNPLLDTDITTTHNGKRDETGNNTNNRNNTGKTETDSTVTDVRSGEHWNYYSDTPQGGITGLANHTYLTNATHDTDSMNDTNTGSSEVDYTDTTVTTDSKTNNTTEEYIEHIIGKRGGESYTKMIVDFRKSLLNIDMQVIHELDDLFLNLW